MLRHVTITGFAAALMALSAGSAAAQATCGDDGAASASCSPTGVEVTATVPHIVRLSITPPSAALSDPTEPDFNGSGIAVIPDLGLHAITVYANATWDLTVTGAAWTGTGNNAKAVGDLEWTSDGGTNYNAVTTSPVSVSTGTATAGTAVTIGYRTTWSLATDTPGTYTMSLTYTVTAP